MVSVAARHTCRSRSLLRNLDGARRDALRARHAVEQTTEASLHALAGDCLLVRSVRRRLLSLSHTQFCLGILPKNVMFLKGLDLLFLEVNNLEESLAFYQGQIGLEILTSNPESEPPMATLRAGSLRITLAQQLETMLKRGRGVHFFLGVTDVDAYYAQLRERGVDVSSRCCSLSCCPWPRFWVWTKPLHRAPAMVSQGCAAPSTIRSRTAASRTRASTASTSVSRARPPAAPGRRRLARDGVAPPVAVGLTLVDLDPPL